MKTFLAQLIFLSLWITGVNLHAQETKVWKVGVLASGTQAQNAARDEALRQGLRALGYEEGKNLSFESKYAEGKLDRLSPMARELVDHKVDLILVGGTQVAVAAKGATNTIPIVVAGAGDLVEAGLIKSYMFPGGNVTGVARMSADFFGARLKLVKELLPKATVVAGLINPKNRGHEQSRRDVELGAQAQGMTFRTVTAATPGELNSAVVSASKSGVHALFIMTDALFNSHVTQLAQTSLKEKLPAFDERSEFVDAGGLVSYGVNLPEISRRAAEYIDKIFKGAKPGDLTLVQSMKFDLAINLKTANQIGVPIPNEVLQRAVKVIK